MSVQPFPGKLWIDLDEIVYLKEIPEYTSAVDGHTSERMWAIKLKSFMEGSTNLTTEQGDAVHQALWARHYARLREEWPDPVETDR